MKSRFAAGFMLVGFLALSGVARADSNLTGNLNLSLGEKFLNNDWKDDDTDLKNQFEVGLLFDIRPITWPVNIAVDMLGSAKKDNGVTGSTSELAVGVRKYFLEKTNVQPFIGGGLANVSAKQTTKVEGTDVSIEDSAIGFWIQTGVQFRPSPHLNVGANLRYTKARIEYFHEDVEAGGVHFGLFAGYGF